MAKRVQPSSDQPLLFAPKWSPPDLSSLPSWGNAKRVCVDVETRDDNLRTLGPGVRRGGYITSIQFAIEDGPAFFLPINFGGDNLDPGKVIDYMREQSKHYKGILVGANLQYDLDYLANEQIEFPQVQWFRDIQLAGPILNEYRHSYSLQSLSDVYGFAGKSDDGLKEACRAHGIKVNSKKWMGEVWKLPARYVEEYGIQDVRLPLQILRRQELEIEKQGLWDIFNLESRVLPVVLDMRRRGVAIDEKKLDYIDGYSKDEERQALDQFHHETGVQVEVGDVWITEPLVKGLSAVGIECPKTKDKAGRDTDTNSVDADFLRSTKHPAAEALLRARQVNKLRTTFVSLVRKHMVRGRIHCTFNQLRRTKDDGSLVGTITGRLSSTNPNMQFQPSTRGVLGSLWREIYLPEPGELWAACDYSQQEFKLVVHYAALSNCPGADKAAQAYHDDPDVDAHDAVAKLVGVERTPAKTINFGVIYGMGGAKMCRSLGLPTEWALSKRLGKKIEVAGPEGKELMDKFHRKAPYLSAMARKASRRAEKVGYVRTLCGRHCRFPMTQKGKRDWTHKALNKLIQGSAADQTKMAMVMCAEAGYKLMLQIHDELDLSVSSPDEAEGVAKIMRECCPLKIPVKVDVEIGKSWGDAK